MKLVQLHMHKGSPLFLLSSPHSPLCRAASTVVATPRLSLLPKAIFTPSIQPNLCLPRTRPPLPPSTPFWSYGIHLFFPHAQTISILSDLLYSLICFSIPALLRTSSFLTRSIRDTPTKLLKQKFEKFDETLHLKNIYFLSLSTSHTPGGSEWIISVGDYVDNLFTALGSSDPREVRLEL